MGLPNHFLPLNVGFTESHNASLFKHELRSKDEVEAYFNDTFGASTAVHAGTEGVNYEYDSEKGYRWITGTGGLVINVSNICDTVYSGTDTPEEKYMTQSGFTFEFEVKSDEWVEKSDSVQGTYINPIPDMNGTAYTASGSWFFTFAQNGSTAQPYVRVYDDATTQVHTNNGMRFFPAFSAGGAYSYQRGVSSYNKPAYMKFKFSLNTHNAQAWIDSIPFRPLLGGVSPTIGGPQAQWQSIGSGVQRREQTVGNWLLYLGTATSQGSGVDRWIRNVRMFSVSTTQVFHPTLRCVASFGDSYSSTMFGPQKTDNASGSQVGVSGDYGSVSTSDFGDINAHMQFVKALNKSGVGAYELCGSGQGGTTFTLGALSLTGQANDYLVQLQRMAPSAIFTYGLHNDTASIRDSATTISALQTLIFDTYMLPMFQLHGLKLWGWVINGTAPDDDNTAYKDAKLLTDNMLLGFPAAWDAAYTNYAGMVKVIDARAEAGGLVPTDSVLWQSHFFSGSNVHPSQYGNALFGEKCAQMALECL